MSNNTAVYWEANGLSLHTKAWSVKTFGGRRYVPVAKRGNDVTVPFRRGATYRPKVRDAQLLTLNMWMLPLNADGTPDDVLTLEQKQHQNWQGMLAALDVEGQYVLTKRWWDGDTVVSAVGMAETVGGLESSVTGGHRLEFDIEMLMTDPYFYGPLTTSESCATLAPVTGDVPTDRVLIVLPSGATTPRVTFPDGNWIEYDGTLGGDLTLDCLNCTAKIGSAYANGKIRRNPKFPTWPMLRPGDEDLTVTDGGTIRYQPAYR